MFKKHRKLFSFAIALCIILSLSTQVFAQSSDTVSSSAKIVTNSLYKLANELEGFDSGVTQTKITSNEHGIAKEFRINSDTKEIQSFLYIPNLIVGSVTPTSTGFVITITNIGVDKIDALGFSLYLYDDYNPISRNFFHSFHT